MAKRTLRNDRSGQEITTELSNEEAAKLFAKHFGGKDNWLWFWIVKSVEGIRDRTTEKGQIFIADAFTLAIGYGLVMPRIRAHYKDQRFKFGLSRKGTITLKSGMLDVIRSSGPGGDAPPVYTHDPVGNEFYVGCLLGGRFLPGREFNNGTPGPERPLTETEREFLQKLSDDPVRFLAECSKDLGRCCYCNQPLTDARSKTLGYGPVCAKHWALPWGDPRYIEKAPSFAKVYGPAAQGLCSDIRSNPKDETAWLVFADWLDEKGLPPCKMPEKAVVLPRND